MGFFQLIPANICELNLHGCIFPDFPIFFDRENQVSSRCDSSATCHFPGILKVPKVHIQLEALYQSTASAASFVGITRLLRHLSPKNLRGYHSSKTISK